MNQIKVTFSDGTVEKFHEEQSFMSIRFIRDEENPDKEFASQSEVFGLWNHIHDGLVPSFLELLANSIFFFDLEKPSIHYNSQAVVKIETVE